MGEVSPRHSKGIDAALVEIGLASIPLDEAEDHLATKRPARILPQASALESASSACAAKDRHIYQTDVTSTTTAP